MRRLQANLAFLAQSAENKPKPGQPTQPGPAIMVAPASPPELVELYKTLQSLYPGWKGQQPQMKASPGPSRLNSTSSLPGSGMQPPNSAGLQNNMQPPNSAGLQNNLLQNMQQSMQHNMQQQQQQQQMHMNFNNLQQH